MDGPEQRYRSIIEKLKDSNHKLTPQRLAIAKFLAQNHGHPTVENIYEQLRGDFPTMSLATVYRNVMLIKSLGEVLELGFADGGNRYDGSRPFPHPHLICVKCRKIVDSDLESLTSMSRELEAQTGFKILTHRLDFFGLCGVCRIGG